LIKRLVSLGSVIVDLVLELPNLPPRGGDVLASQRGMAVGGAFNVLSAASRLGLPGAYAGPHGTGPFGDLVRAELAREGISVGSPPNPGLDTGWTIAMIEPDGERTFVTVTGADAIADSEALRSTEYLDGDAVYVSGYDLAYPSAGPAIAQHVAALDRQLFVAFDPGPLVAEIAADRRDAVLRRADMVSLNEREAEALGGADGVMQQVRADATVVIRQGRLGAAIHEARFEWLQIPAVALDDVRDTSGAGDVHVGANLAGLGQGMSWRDAVLLANHAAAYAVSRDGPASGPTAAQLENFGAGRW
jgi:sugar/nucleoside kinase (ribokinase family)